MQQAPATREISSSGIGETRTSRIHANANVFALLYNNLYTRKAEAVFRELVNGNAYDAHVEAGTTDTPIELHMPTVLESWFSVRDYGPGLAPEQIEANYMDLGNSTKTTSNDLIGAFGQGSKSPFAVTDQFTVISRHNGKKFTYLAYLDDTGCPVSTMAGCDPTDEANGLEVQVPIPERGSLFEDFDQAARKLLPYYPLPYTTNLPLNLEDVDEHVLDTVDSPAPGVQCAKFLDRSAIQQYRDAAMIVVMGTVPYRADTSALFRRLGEHPERRFTLEFAHSTVGILRYAEWPLRLHVDIGTCSVTGSRESLSFDDRTTDFLVNATVHAINALYDRYVEHANAATNLIDWARAVKALGIDKASLPPQLKAWHPYVPDLDHIDWGGYLLSKGCTIRSIVSHDPGTKNRYRPLSPRTRGVGRIGLSKDPLQAIPTRVYIHPKAIPYRTFCDQYFSPEHMSHVTPKRIIIMRGDKDAARQAFQDLGFTNVEILDLPVVTQPQSQHARRFGKTQYYMYDSAAERPVQYKTAAQFLDYLDDKDPKTTAVVIPKKSAAEFSTSLPGQQSKPKVTWLRDFDHYVVVSIKTSHTKVMGELASLAKEQGFQVYDSMSSLISEQLVLSKRISALIGKGLALRRVGVCGNRPELNSAVQTLSILNPDLFRRIKLDRCIEWARMKRPRKLQWTLDRMAGRNPRDWTFRDERIHQRHTNVFDGWTYDLWRLVHNQLDPKLIRRAYVRTSIRLMRHRARFGAEIEARSKVCRKDLLTILKNYRVVQSATQAEDEAIAALHRALFKTENDQ